MNEKIYYSAEDIAKMLGVSMGKSYKILREMNKDLASKGFLTIAGKIPVEYFKEKWYGGAKEVTNHVSVEDQGFNRYMGEKIGIGRVLCFYRKLYGKRDKRN